MGGSGFYCRSNVVKLLGVLVVRLLVAIDDGGELEGERSVGETGELQFGL